jgi:hypothetical protein
LSRPTKVGLLCFFACAEDQRGHRIRRIRPKESPTSSGLAVGRDAALSGKKTAAVIAAAMNWIRVI